MRTGRFLLSVIAATVFTAGFMWNGTRAGAAQSVLSLEGDVSPVHDPVVIKEKGTYYVFCTGGRSGQGVLPIRTSADMRTWKAAGFVFESLPEWVGREVPMARNAWAPDIAYFNGKYHLYYSVSSFGSRNSAIGLATTRTLDPSSTDYSWTDEGIVLRSYQDKDDWNAIDPNLVLDGDRAWLTWGSFWGGIKMRRIDPATGKLAAADDDDAFPEQPSARAADQRLGGSPVHRPSRRLLVPVRVVRSLLPRRAEHLQRGGRPLTRR